MVLDFPFEPWYNGLTIKRGRTDDMSLYSLRSVPELHGYVIHKFDDDFNVEAVYDLEPSPNLGGGWSCSCPAASRESCRHRQMLPVFQATGHIDDGAFYDFENRRWLPPMGESASVEPIEAADEQAEDADELAEVIDQEEEEEARASEANSKTSASSEPATPADDLIEVGVSPIASAIDRNVGNPGTIRRRI